MANEKEIKITNDKRSKLHDFRTLVKRSVFLNKQEMELFNKIPDILFERILTKNFNNNLKLAERILLNRYSDIEKTDKPNLEQKKNQIKNLNKASEKISDAMNSGKKVLFLTDNDNDGSMAQSVLLEFFNILPESMRQNVYKAYAQPIGGARGLNLENVDLLLDFLGWNNEDILLVTADIGINNGVEQNKILEKYSNIDLIVSDHHLPQPKHQVVENERTVIFNPKYQPTEYFKKNNISGTETLDVLLKNVLNQLNSKNKKFRDNIKSKFKGSVDKVSQALFNMSEIGVWSNLLDYVDANVVDMPLRPYTIKKALELRALLNVSNSMGTLVTLDWDENDWAKLENQVPSLNVDLIKESVLKIKGLNVFAQKLLTMASKYEGNEDIDFNKKTFFADLADILDNEDKLYETANPNYIAQLRPNIFRFSVIDNKYPFFELMNSQMISLFENLRSVEKEIIKELQNTELLNRIKDEHSIIVYPKASHLTKIFPRKLLNKVYNEENNGFVLTLDKASHDEYSGSMRSLYPMDEILSDEEALEEKLGIDIEILGHSKAAGFKIYPKDKKQKITKKLLKDLNKEINQRIEVIKQNEKLHTLPFLSIDFASVNLVNKINKAVKAHLSNMNGLPAIVQLGEKGKSDVYITDSETTNQISLKKVVDSRKYGYQPIQTDLKGGAFIIPVEQLRSVVKSKFSNAVLMSYMDDGAFIANQVVDLNSIKNLVDFKADRKEETDLIKYYEETFKNNDNHFIELERKDFLNLPYFKYNKYGVSEFEHFEQLTIGLLEKTNQDLIAVIDTEGTGLGQAPKCFNIGGTNIKIKEGSGFDMDEAVFNKHLFKDKEGHYYLLQDELLNNLKKSDKEDEDEKNKIKDNLNDYLFLTSVDKINGTSDDVWYTLIGEDKKKVIKITNSTYKNNKVYCNREIDGFAFSYIIKEDDFKITKDFENLTGISQFMVDKLGSSVKKVDTELSDFYNNLKNKEGKKAKIIFTAHNLPYDKGIVRSNLNKLETVMDKHLLCDTAKLARKAKLAYDDTPLSHFEDINAIPKSSKVYFYNSEYSSYSLSKFIERAKEGKSGVYPDTSGRYLIRYNKDTDKLSFIDKEQKNEVLMDEDLGLLEEKMINGKMPGNAIKYSVEKLSMRAMIRNILLSDYEKPQTVELTASEKKFEKSLIRFQSHYHFDNSLEENIEFFVKSSNENFSKGITEETLKTLMSVGKRFLGKNKDIQAKFHDSWIYEKVLSLYEPAVNEGVIPQDAIEQVNYYTDLPRNKIKEVFTNTINFKKKFNIKDALVHEQHNNIRQRSEDGHGLADTAYESVLPNLLTMMKYYNPYDESSSQAIGHIVNENIKESMKQLKVKDNHQDLAAVDSFSMNQMKAFDREEKTNLVDKAQKWIDMGGYNKNKTPIRFKLKSGTLPPGSGIYATPKKPLTTEEIKECSDKLNFILLNEQVKVASRINNSISMHYGEILKNITEGNDKKCIAFKNDIMSYFDNVRFLRKEDAVKKISKIIDNIFQGKEPKFTNSLITELRKEPELLLLATDMQVTIHNIEKQLGCKNALSKDKVRKLSAFFDTMTELVQTEQVGDPKLAKQLVNNNRPLALTEVNVCDSDSLVRDDDFLPNLKIRRDEPLKFLLNYGGAQFVGNYLLKKYSDNNTVLCNKVADNQIKKDFKM